MLVVFKALSSEARLNILRWLKDPIENFPEDIHDGKGIGICVGQIQKRSGLSISATSTHISVLQRAGLVKPTRKGQWTYYRRDEEAIGAFVSKLGVEL